MTPNTFQLSVALALLALPVAWCGTTPIHGTTRATGDSAGPARVVFSHVLPPLDGAHLTVTVVEVHYGPGGSSAPHRHPCAVIGYVLEGALRSQVQGEAESTYTAGQSFFEAPNAVHVVSANASAEQPVRFLASFTCDRVMPLSVPVPPAHDSLMRHP
ncbi:MAG: cupin domain-containing protein [Gemmatimonadota bacterium]